MVRGLLGFLLLGLVACRSPAPAPERARRAEARPPSETTEHAEVVPPSRDALRAIVAEHLELTEIFGPEVSDGLWLTSGFLFCATARSPGSFEVGLRDPRDPASVGRVSVHIQPRGEARAIRLTGEAVLDVGDTLCLLAPASDPPWAWFRPDPASRSEQRAPVELGPLRPTDGTTHERAAIFAPQLVDPRRIRVGDEEGFSHVRFTAAEEGQHYHGGMFMVAASRAEPVRVDVQAFPPLGVFGPVQLRPGDTLTMSRRTLEADLPVPALEGL